jgi:hypothetical protein
VEGLDDRRARGLEREANARHVVGGLVDEELVRVEVARALGGADGRVGLGRLPP